MRLNKVNIKSIKLSSCHPNIQRQYKKTTDTTTIEKALESKFYKIARVWFDAGFVVIPTSDKKDSTKLPGLWDWTYLHTGGFSDWSESDLVYAARMFPHSNGLLLLGSPIKWENRLIGIDNDSSFAELDTWITDSFGPSLKVGTGRVGGTHHYYKYNSLYTPISGQMSKNGRIGPDYIWEFKADEKGKGKWRSKIDIKAQGGYLVAVGSRHKSGKYYKVLDTNKISINPDQIKNIPKIQADIALFEKAKPDNAQTTPNSSDVNIGVTASGYTRLKADFSLPEWSAAYQQSFGMLHETHKSVPCLVPGHNHSKINNKKAHVNMTSTGYITYVCHDESEVYIDSNLLELREIEDKVQATKVKEVLAPKRLTDQDRHEFLYLKAKFLFESLNPEAWYLCPNTNTSLLQKNTDEAVYSSTYFRRRTCTSYACEVCGPRQIKGYIAAYSALVEEWHLDCKSLLLSNTFTPTGDGIPVDASTISFSIEASTGISSLFGAQVHDTSTNLVERGDYLRNWASEKPEGERRYICVTTTPGIQIWCAMWAGSVFDGPSGFVPEDILDFKSSLLKTISSIDLEGWKGYTGKTRPIDGQLITKKPARILREQVTGHAPPPWIETKESRVLKLEKELMHRELQEKWDNGELPLYTDQEIVSELKKRIRVASEEIIQNTSNKLLICDSKMNPEKITELLSEVVGKDMRVDGIEVGALEAASLAHYPTQTLITDATPKEIEEAAISLRGVVGDLRTRIDARKYRDSNSELIEGNGLMFVD